MLWILRTMLLFLALPLWAQSGVAYMEAGTKATGGFTSDFSEITRLPFQRVGGILLLDARVDGKLGQFILDTGAPGLILNGKPGLSDGLVQGMGLHGQLEIEAVAVAQFEMGSLVRRNVTAYVLDMEHLEQATGRPIAGLIGHTVLDNLELYLDLEQGMVELHPGRTSTLIQTLGQPLLEIPFILRNHLPVVKVKIGKRTYRLGIDSGAEVNVLNESLFNKLKPNQEGLVMRHRIRGLDQQIHEVRSVDISAVQIQGSTMPSQRYYFTDLTAIRQLHQLSIDGLLGYPFLQQYRVSVNYQTRTIRLWEKS
jgi:hypothetical protein